MLALFGFLGRLDAFHRQETVLRDAGFFYGFACVDLCLIEVAVAFDLEVARFAVGRYPHGRHGFLLHDPQFLRRFTLCDFGFADGQIACDFSLPGRLLVFYPRVGDSFFLSNPGTLHSLARRDAFRVHGLLAINVFGLGFKLLCNARLFQCLFLRNPCCFDGFACCDLGNIRLLTGFDTLFSQGFFLRDARLFDGFTRRNVGLFHNLLALDLALPDLAFRCNAGFGNLTLVLDPRRLDGLTGQKRRLLGILFAFGPFAGQFGTLLRATEFHFALLVQSRLFGFLFDIQSLFFGFQIARTDLYHRVLLDVVAHLAARFDRFDDTRQTFSVELVGRVEVLDVGLVDIRGRNAFKLKTVLVQTLLRHVLDPGHVFVAVLVNFLKRHLGRHRPKRRDKFAGQQGMNALRLQSSAPER